MCEILCEGNGGNSCQAQRNQDITELGYPIFYGNGIELCTSFPLGLLRKNRQVFFQAISPILFQMLCGFKEKLGRYLGQGARGE